ncbi:TonB-dependent siderophore receptor [Plectonema cf. radiosum LEGE 06105]|uniref:TonB-dependent siderophore receptor n=1 Tax=Plectonema cf. radiosum LEGE 06105 TaxID=945769 RepID=A0A8J7K564_9CYAN|nr:TonB-dependent siderophore receptor [Plectonema cf. radiosum LEGE 06105]
MKQQLFMIQVWLISIVSIVLAVAPGLAKETQATSNSVVNSSLIAQSTPTNNRIKVTAVELYETDVGLEVVLKTLNPQLLKPASTTVVGNTIVTDIPNAVLELPQREEFQLANPLTGIALVRVSNINGNGIRIEITGQDAPPTATVPRTQGEEFILGVSPVEGTNAQTPQQPQQKPEQPQQSDDVIELVVTGSATPQRYRIIESSVGTRTDTPVINIPQSIQAIPEQVLEEQGTTNLGEALRNSAGVTTGRVASDAPSITPVIRGFESENTLRNGLRDTTLGTLAEITNVERFEILKGPASVLFGQGDLGGTVNIITKVPLNEPSYKFDYQVGQFNLHRPSIDFTGPLGNRTDSPAYRLTSSYQWSDSFRDFEERRTFFVSPVLKLINSDRTQLIAELEHLTYNTTGSAPELPALGTVLDNPEGEVDSSVNLGEPSLSRNESRATRWGYRFKHEFSDNLTFANELLVSEVDVPESSFILPRGLRGDNRTLDRIFVENPNELSSLNLNTSLSGKFATGNIKHELLFGVELSRDTFEDKLDLNIFGISAINIFDPQYSPESVNSIPGLSEESKTTTNSIGFYLQDQISLSEQWIVVLGGRFDIADQTYEDRFDLRQSFDRTDEAFSPRAGVVYKPAENISFYGSYTRSFKPIIGRETSLDVETNDFITGEPFEPERGTQYEIGVKADLLNDRLSTTLALFHLERTNVIEESAIGQVGSQQTGKQRSQGVEVTIAGEILPGWNLLSSYAYTDAIISEDDVLPEGNSLRNVPKHGASLWTTYQIQSGSLQGLGFGLGLYYVGKREGDLLNSFSLPSYLRTDASIFYRRNNFGASLNFQNLFDVNYYEGARNDLRVIPGAPFAVFGKISLEF